VTLIEFLAARLDDDEAYARNAFGSHNDAIADWHEQWSGAVNIGDTEDLIATGDSQVSRFIARFDPARVLREVAGGRAILAMHGPTQGHPEFGMTYPEAAKFCGWCGPGDSWQAAQEPDHFPGALWPCRHARLLASVYSDHPDYDETWRL
jgi:hypothetical protein